MAGRLTKAAALLAGGAIAATALAAAAASGLAWDRLEAVSQASPGQESAEFVFMARNPTDRPVVVEGISSSCRCTTAWFPASPWTIPAHGSSPLHAEIRLSGQRDEVVKQVYVDTDAGTSTLTLKVEPPAAAKP
jgi:hypothetical protein